MERDQNIWMRVSRCYNTKIWPTWLKNDSIVGGSHPRRVVIWLLQIITSVGLLNDIYLGGDFTLMTLLLQRGKSVSSNLSVRSMEKLYQLQKSSREVLVICTQFYLYRKFPYFFCLELLFQWLNELQLMGTHTE